MELQTGLHHAPTRWSDGNRSVYTLPWWLAQTWRSKQRWNSLRVQIDHEGRGIVVEDASSRAPMDPEELHGVVLRRKRPSRRRRERLAAVASSCLHEPETIPGGTRSVSTWLRRIRANLLMAEKEALSVWNAFVASCDVPPSFRLRGRRLSLGDLLRLSKGSDGGRHRYSFAEHQPWAVPKILRGPRPDRELARIDKNPADRIILSAKHLCCREKRMPCDEAAAFAKAIPRYRKMVELDRVLGSACEGEARCRLIKAHYIDGGDLLSHVVRDAVQTRLQITWACGLGRAYRDGEAGWSGCAGFMELDLLRMMIRDGFDPRFFSVRRVARGLAALSADCLAAFAAAHVPEPSFRRDGLYIFRRKPAADALDMGLIAFLHYSVSVLRPRLTARQLVKLAVAAVRRGVHRNERGTSDSMRSFNVDPAVAQDRWERIYAQFVPRRLALVSPAVMVDSFLACHPYPMQGYRLFGKLACPLEEEVGE